MNIFIKALRLSLVISAMSLPLTYYSVGHAQFSNNSNADTVIDADDSQRVGDLIILTGQVDIRQGDTRLLADKVTLKTGGDPNKNSGIISADAVGNFYYITGQQEVRGDKGVFESASDIFTVTGNVILVQDDNVVTGDRLLYNVVTEKAQVQSNCKGRKCGPRRRVSILIKSNGTIQNNP